MLTFFLFTFFNDFAQKPALNYPAFLAKHNLVFDSLSTKWEDGAFLGNGLLGVMVYREDANAIRFDLGRTDVVDHREGINPSIGRARMPIGRFVLHTKGKIQKINLRVDLWNVEGTKAKEMVFIRGLCLHRPKRRINNGMKEYNKLNAEGLWRHRPRGERE